MRISDWSSDVCSSDLLGRTILDGAKRVRISGRTISVQARIRTIGSYTGHADQAEPVGWIEDRRPIAGSLLLTHGEERSVHALASHLTPLGIAIGTASCWERVSPSG